MKNWFYSFRMNINIKIRVVIAALTVLLSPAHDQRRRQRRPCGTHMLCAVLQTTASWMRTTRPQTLFDARMRFWFAAKHRTMEKRQTNKINAFFFVEICTQSSQTSFRLKFIKKKMFINLFANRKLFFLCVFYSKNCFIRSLPFIHYRRSYFRHSAMCTSGELQTC